MGSATPQEGRKLVNATAADPTGIQQTPFKSGACSAFCISPERRSTMSRGAGGTA
jgi:hypothetical protein